jgi:hypothetical protein
MSREFHDGLKAEGQLPATHDRELIGDGGGPAPG